MITKDEIIKKGIEVFNGIYDYSLIGNINTKKDKFPIICHKHGVFYKNYYRHFVKKQGCTECVGKKRYNTEEFVNKVKNLEHTKNYSFDNVDYINNKTKIKVYCHHIDDNGNEHGIFEISPSHLLAGEGCPKCRYIKSAFGRRRSIEEIINEANQVHNNKYSYEMINSYKNDRIKYPIICPEHGVFYQTMNNHIKAKQGCPVCGRIKCDESRKDTFDDFVRKSKLVHGDKYVYNDKNYINTDTKIGITCKEHGVFYMEPGNHIMGQGCPKCYREKSCVERELFDYINQLLPNNTIEENNRTILNGKEIDVYVPELKIGFEMNGLIWHSNKFEIDNTYHIKKTETALKKGITLIHIFEDEWLLKNEICKSRISNILGVTNKKIYARNCVIKEVSYKDTVTSLETNHIQGKTASSINIGLYYNNTLIQLMTFGKKRINVGCKHNDNHYELIRFCNELNTIVIGGASKLFKYFINKYNPDEIISYADRRWSQGNLYEKLGFVLTHTSKPNYFYVINKKRINRYTLRKNVLVEKYGCPKEMTEKDFCYNKGWYRIYDCGCLCYKWKKNDSLYGRKKI